MQIMQIHFVSHPSWGLKPPRTVAELQETQERLFREEHTCRGGRQQAGAARCSQEREGRRNWVLALKDATAPWGARLPLRTSDSDYRHWRKLAAQRGSREISFRPH